MKTLIIVPGKECYTDSPFYILDSDTGEVLASHFCSNYSFAYGDLYANRPERIEEWKKRFGDFNVKYIDDADITEDQLLERNKKWFASLPNDQRG